MFDLAAVPVPDLSGKTILVTGAGRGIGSHLVEILTSRGARVFAGLAGKADEAAAARLSGAETLRLDVTEQRDADAAIAHIRSTAGKLDALVNNAGVIAPIDHLVNLDPRGLGQAFEVNVLGVHRMTVAAHPMLAASKGVIVNAGTGAATTPLEGWTAYCCSKAAARMLTQMIGLELAGDGIKCFFVGIPPTDTDMQAEIRASGLNAVSRIKREDLVAPAVPASVMAWLCGDQAKTLDNPFLDVRDDLFVDMMKLD